MIKFFTTIIRFIVALVVTPSIVVFSILVLLLETTLVLVSFPFAAIFMHRDDIRKSWLGSYPNSSPLMGKGLRNNWRWVFDEDTSLERTKTWSITLLSLVVHFLVGVVAAIIWGGFGQLLLRSLIWYGYFPRIGWDLTVYVLGTLGFFCGLIRGKIIED